MQGGRPVRLLVEQGSARPRGRCGLLGRRGMGVVFSVAVEDVDDVVPGIHGRVGGHMGRCVGLVDDWREDHDPTGGGVSAVGGVGYEVWVG